jgi:integrase
MKWLKAEDRDKFFAWLDSGVIPNSLYGPYYRLYLAIAMEAGLRVTEIVGGKTAAGIILGLTHGHYNPTTQRWEAVLRLKRKVKTYRDAFLGPRTIRIYRDVFPGGGESSQPIFPPKMNRNDCYKWTKRLAKSLGIEQDVTPHTMRHTLGHDVYVKQGRDIMKVQKALAHASAATSMVYAEATDEEGIQAISNVRGDDSE